MLPRMRLPTKIQYHTIWYPAYFCLAEVSFALKTSTPKTNMFLINQERNFNYELGVLFSLFHMLLKIECSKLFTNSLFGFLIWFLTKCFTILFPSTWVFWTVVALFFVKQGPMNRVHSLLKLCYSAGRKLVTKQHLQIFSGNLHFSEVTACCMYCLPV